MQASEQNRRGDAQLPAGRCALPGRRSLEDLFLDLVRDEPGTEAGPTPDLEPAA